MFRIVLVDFIRCLIAVIDDCRYAECLRPCESEVSEQRGELVMMELLRVGNSIEFEVSDWLNWLHDLDVHVIRA